MTEGKWQRSSACGGGGNNCVEIAAVGDRLALRESTRPTEVLMTGRNALLSLIRGVKVNVVTPRQSGSRA